MRRLRRSGDGQWTERKPLTLKSKPAAMYTFGISQDSNTPPELSVTDPLSKKTTVLTNLNPQLKERELCAVELFAWEDVSGKRLKGGLLYPRGYQPGKRYPIVLQTYGFNPHHFLSDGPNGITAAYAARPLADAGLMVLQMDTLTPMASTFVCRNWEACGERSTFIRIVESAIEALDAKGLIDRQRVGLVGWSREGLHVFDAVTFGKYPLAAAVVADSVAYSPFAYAMAYGTSFPGLLEFEKMMGGSYWGEYKSIWDRSSPALMVDRISTPLRFEQYGAAISNYWDVFVNLKRHSKPVEMLHIPLEWHLLTTPFGRYASQQGNVDWFRFWLNNEEDADPAKAEQYVRWRALRSQQQEHLRSSQPSASRQ